jgi:hypothetical protein
MAAKAHCMCACAARVNLTGRKRKSDLQTVNFVCDKYGRC